LATLEETLSQKHDLTEQDYENFKDEFRYWTQRYSLNNWEFHFFFEDDSEENPSRARLMTDHDARICLVTLCKVWEGEEPTEIAIRQSAYHEVVELLLSNMNLLIRQRSVLEREVEEQVHVVIRTLENAHYFEDIKRRKAK